MARLRSDAYGKRQVRLVKLERGPIRHELRDLTLSIQLEGDFEAVYAKGDNEGLLTTDSMRNMAYLIAYERSIGSPEDFAARLARRLLEVSSHTSRSRVEVVEHGWSPVEVGDRTYPDAFRKEGGTRTATVTMTKGGDLAFESGIDGVVLLKSAGSRFRGFLQEPHTSLAESDDRILATSLSASWRYDAIPDDWGESWLLVRDALLEEFARHQSDSVQHTLFQLGERALEACPGLRQLHLRLPNVHHLPFDVTRFGGEAQNNVFEVAREPFGDIRGTVVRDRGV